MAFHYTAERHAQGRFMATPIGTRRAPTAVSRAGEWLSARRVTGDELVFAWTENAESQSQLYGDDLTAGIESLPLFTLEVP